MGTLLLASEMPVSIPRSPSRGVVLYYGKGRAGCELSLVNFEIRPGPGRDCPHACFLNRCAAGCDRTRLLFHDNGAAKVKVTSPGPRCARPGASNDHVHM